MYDKTLKKIIKYYQGIVDESIEVTPDSSLMEDLGLSSLALFNSLMAFEVEYDITVPEKYLKRMITVSDVAGVLVELKEKKKR